MGLDLIGKGTKIFEYKLLSLHLDLLFHVFDDDESLDSLLFFFLIYFGEY